MIAIAAGIGFCALTLALIYNNLVMKKNAYQNCFSTIDVQLKQRHDLIPNLVAAVKGYMQHERELLERLTQLRTAATASGLDIQGRARVEGGIAQSLGQIMVSVENYPQLKADSSFIRLQKSLNEVEEQIAAARRTFNAAVTAYNNAVETFPSNMVANSMGFERAELFVIDEVARANISVELGSK